MGLSLNIPTLPKSRNSEYDVKEDFTAFKISGNTDRLVLIDDHIDYDNLLILSRFIYLLGSGTKCIHELYKNPDQPAVKIYQ